MDLKTVQRIAQLSYLQISDEELARFTRELSSILDHVSGLERLDLSSAEPTAHAAFTRNVFRDDDAVAQENTARAAVLVNAAPESEEGYVKVKAVL